MAGEQYQVNWSVPVADTKFYRLTVKVGSKTLGWADLETGASGAALKNVTTGDFVPLVDGRTLPIKFRIERLALCDSPGDPDMPCTSTTVDLAAGATVSTVLPGSTLPSGITIPSQGTAAPPATVTVQACADLHGRATDLPTFGPCVRVTAELVTPDANGSSTVIFSPTNPATIFSCDVDRAVHAAIDDGRMLPTQEPLVTLHRLDDFGLPTQRLAALQHAAACGGGTFSAHSGPVRALKGMLANLVHGNLKLAARGVASLLAPKPLYAGMFIDLGGGGFSIELSDFQFALPAKMELVPGTDGAIVEDGAVLHPTVKVTDLHGYPVQGADVHFFTATPSASGDVTGTSGADGAAGVPWTISLASGRLVASGRGIAGPDHNGPRGASRDESGALHDDLVDPFQPIHSPFDDGVSDGPEVTVVTGSVVFNITPFAAPTDRFDFMSGNFIYTSGASLPTGWETVGFVPGAGWKLASAPFSSGGCGGPPATAWTANSDILVRKNFTTTSAGTLTFNVQIDNDLQIWLDGTEITSTGVTTDRTFSFYGPSPNGPAGNWWVHDFCATNSDAPTFVVPMTMTTASAVPAGKHVLAIRAHDRGGDTYLDVQFVRN
jgi:hypothetical protein